MTTDKWTFWSAVYFCMHHIIYRVVGCFVDLLFLSGYITFTTVGYGNGVSGSANTCFCANIVFSGDMTPKTPAGRSIFVFWALLGVATMTILISGAVYFLDDEIAWFLTKF